jgi:hypothetical protein
VGGSAGGRSGCGVRHGGRAGVTIEWERERYRSAAQGKDKEERGRWVSWFSAGQVCPFPSRRPLYINSV